MALGIGGRPAWHGVPSAPPQLAGQWAPGALVDGNDPNPPITLEDPPFLGEAADLPPPRARLGCAGFALGTSILLFTSPAADLPVGAQSTPVPQGGGALLITTSTLLADDATPAIRPTLQVVPPRASAASVSWLLAGIRDLTVTLPSGVGSSALPVSRRTLPPSGPGQALTSVLTDPANAPVGAVACAVPSPASRRVPPPWTDGGVSLKAVTASAVPVFPVLNPPVAPLASWLSITNVYPTDDAEIAPRLPGVAQPPRRSSSLPPSTAPQGMPPTASTPAPVPPSAPVVPPRRPAGPPPGVSLWYVIDDNLPPVAQVASVPARPTSRGVGLAIGSPLALVSAPVPDPVRPVTGRPQGLVAASVSAYRSTPIALIAQPASLPPGLRHTLAPTAPVRRPPTVAAGVYPPTLVVSASAPSGGQWGTLPPRGAVSLAVRRLVYGPDPGSIPPDTTPASGNLWEDITQTPGATPYGAPVAGTGTSPFGAPPTPRGKSPWDLP